MNTKLKKIRNIIFIGIKNIKDIEIKKRVVLVNQIALLFGLLGIPFMLGIFLYTKSIIATLSVIPIVIMFVLCVVENHMEYFIF